MTEQTLNDLERFLGKIVMEIAYRPTRDEAARLLTAVRTERGSNPDATTYGRLA